MPGERRAPAHGNLASERRAPGRERARPRQPRREQWPQRAEDLADEPDRPGKLHGQGNQSGGRGQVLRQARRPGARRLPAQQGRGRRADGGEARAAVLQGEIRAQGPARGRHDQVRVHRRWEAGAQGEAYSARDNFANCISAVRSEYPLSRLRCWPKILI